MLSQSIILLLASAGLIEARSVLDVRQVHGVHGFMHKRAADATETTLAANAIQSGSFVDGSQEVGAAEVGQAKSLTSTNNFINNCAGKTLTNGLQITTGSCNGITMGDIPAKTAMVSSIITFPLAGSSTLQSDTTFNITVQMSNLVAGSFTNADATYYAAPQALSGGLVVGHTHVTVQDMGSSLNPTTPLDPTQFAFFKGINDAGNGQGLLSATVTGGLPAGNYRVCTIASASNHQPVLMPVAQRGTADDCTKFTVIGNGQVANAASNSGSGGLAAAAAAASAVAAGPGAVVDPADASGSSAASSSTATTSTKAAKDAASSVAESSSTSASSLESSAAAQATKSGEKAAPSVAPFANSTIIPSAQTTPATSSNAPAPAQTSGAPAVSAASALGGIAAPAITDSGDATRPFAVNGNTFVNKAAAVQRSCDVQFNACADAFNGGKATGFNLTDCQSQEDSCIDAGSS